MAGNILYIQYTFFIVLMIVVFTILIFKWKGSTLTKRFLSVILPLFFLCQLYFWNMSFNDLIKSSVAPTLTYTCIFEEEETNLSIRLPERTILKFKEDGCSDFYTTYLDEEKFTSFYTRELKTLKDREAIESFTSVENQEGDTSIQTFSVVLSSGSNIEIALVRMDKPGKWTMSIKYYTKQ